MAFNQDPRRRPITFYDCRIIWPNFSGKAGKYNEEGERFVNLVLDEGTALAMKADGWNIKAREPRDAQKNIIDGDPMYYVEVAVSFRGHTPPKCVLISGKNQEDLTAPDEDGVVHADNINVLDAVTPEKIDMIINPSPWERDGRSGIKAYLKTIYVTQQLDDLELLYGNFSDEDPGDRD